MKFKYKKMNIRLLKQDYETVLAKIDESITGPAGTKGDRVTKETRAKISKARRGKILSEETKRRVSLSLLGNQNWKGHKVA